MSTLPTDSPSSWAPASYTTDLVPRPVLYGAALRSRGAGRLLSVDTAALRAVPGVVAVLTAADDDTASWSGSPHGGPPERRILTDRPRAAGDPVAAVVATTPEALAAARRAFRHEVDDVVDLPQRLPGPAFGRAHAEVAAALATAPVQHRLTVELDSGPQAAMERPAAAACWDDGRLTLWSTTQCPQPLGERVAEVFGLAPAAVTVVPARLGGGFGGKEEVILEPLAALLSRSCGGARVLVEMPRREALHHYRRHGARVTSLVGLDDDGRLLARWIDVDLHCGAYLGHADHIAVNGLRAALSLYPCPVVGGSSTLVVDAQPGRGAFRGYGGPQVNLAAEHQLDLVARQLGLTPYEIRRRNLAPAGGADGPGPGGLAARALACLDALERAPEEPCGADRPGALVGTGIALGLNISSISSTAVKDASTASCGVAGDGFEVHVGVVDMGQGIHRSAALVAARELDCPLDRIRVVQPASDAAPRDAGSFASRGAYVVLGAVAEACRALRGLLDDAAGGPDRYRSADAAGLRTTGGRALGWDAVAGLRATGAFIAPDDGMAVAAQRVVLALDAERCAATIRSVTSVHDVGRLIDHSRAELQVVGGVLQGIGWMLRELPPADPDAPTLLHAGVPTVHDAPPTSVVFVEEANPESPIGARGLGEIPTVAMLAAIANATLDVTGREVASVPLTADRLAALLPAYGDERPLAH